PGDGPTDMIHRVLSMRGGLPPGAHRPGDEAAVDPSGPPAHGGPHRAVRTAPALTWSSSASSRAQCGVRPVRAKGALLGRVLGAYGGRPDEHPVISEVSQVVGRTAHSMVHAKCTRAGSRQARFPSTPRDVCLRYPGDAQTMSTWRLCGPAH